MTVANTKFDIIRGIILDDINTLWDLADKDVDLFKKTLIKLSDDSVSSGDFSKYCEKLVGTEDLFSTTLKALRKIAFANEDVTNKLNTQHQNLQATVFELKTGFSNVLSEIFAEIDAKSSYLLSPSYESETLAKTALIRDFLAVEDDTSVNALEHSKPQLNIGAVKTNSVDHETITLDDEPSETYVANVTKKLADLLNRFNNITDTDERNRINAQVRQLIEHHDNRTNPLDFSHFNLGGLDLSDLDISNSNFTNAQLKGTNLCGANLAKAKFNDANLSGAMIDDDTIFSGNSFVQATVDRDVLSILAKGAKGPNNDYDLREIIAARLDLSDLDLSDVDFTGSNFYSSDFSDTNMEGCDLTDVNFDNAINFNTYTHQPPQEKIDSNPNDAILRQLIEKKSQGVGDETVNKKTVSFFSETS